MCERKREHSGEGERVHKSCGRMLKCEKKEQGVGVGGMETHENENVGMENAHGLCFLCAQGAQWA